MKNVWVTKEGERLLISEMGDNHLRNAQRFSIRKIKQWSLNFLMLTFEILYRDIFKRVGARSCGYCVRKEFCGRLALFEHIGVPVPQGIADNCIMYTRKWYLLWRSK